MKLQFIIDKKYDLETVPDKREVNRRYKETKKYLQKTQLLYQKSWDEINDRFFRTVEKITGYSWKHKNYYCVLSLFHRGISSWGGNKIARIWSENPYKMRKITAHELLISHIFTIFERDFGEEKLVPKEKWALAEIFAFAICGLEKDVLLFWPWITEQEKYPLNHNYPELYALQRKLKPIYERKKTFRESLRKGIELVKKDK